MLDCSQILAGPFCTMHLSDMGADVIKVEKPAGGDDVRGWGPFKGDESVPFMQLNRNKRSVVLDLRADAGKDAFKKLASRSDILIENFRPGTMEKLGLGYETLRKGHEALIYCSISGFGKTGPYARRAGFDLVAQGMSGIMSFTGFEGMPPAKAGVPVADMTAGMYAVYGILTAYIHRLKTGKGQYLETSLLESAITYTVWESAIFFATGSVAGPLGSGHRLVAPYQALRTFDGYMNLGGANQPNWERFCQAIGRPELLTDARFRDNTARMQNKKALESEIEKTLTTRPTAHWIKLMDEAGIPAGPIYDIEQVWADEQVRARRHGRGDRAPDRRSSPQHRAGGEAVGDPGQDQVGRASPRSAHRRGVDRGRHVGRRSRRPSRAGHHGATRPRQEVRLTGSTSREKQSAPGNARGPICIRQDQD